MTKKCCELCGHNDATTTVRMTCTDPYDDKAACEKCKEWQADLDWQDTQHHLAEEHFNMHGREYFGWLRSDEG